MAEPNLDGDGSSSFQRTVILKDWWLIKCSKEFDGKRFGVAGIELAASVETRAMRVFTSSPIIKAFDVFTLQASDGICITLRGFFNKERVVKCGFIPQISRDFIFGFPPCWEQICNNCFGGVPFGADISTVPSIIDKACCPSLSPCNTTKRNLEDRPAESRDKSIVTEKNTPEINDKDGHSGGSQARDEKTVRKKSLRLQSRSGGKNAEVERKLELSKVQNATDDGDHDSNGLNKTKSSNVESSEHEPINKGDVERKCSECKIQNLTNDGDHGNNGLDMANTKSSDADKDEGEANNEVISPANECGTSADNVDKVKVRGLLKNSLTSEQREGELEVTTGSPNSMFKDLDKSSKPGKKGISKRRGKTLKNHLGTKVESEKNNEASKVQNPATNDGDHGSEGLNKAKSNAVKEDECVAINNEVISPVDRCGRRHSGTDSVGKLTSENATKESLTSEQRKGKLKITRASLHSLSKDINNSSKPGKKGKSKKSEKTLKSDRSGVEPMNHSGSKVKAAEENLSGKKTKRKLDFNVTPDKEVKKQKTNEVSNDSLGQKRSRSGRVLVSSLEYWRNQIPVYDMDRNLIQVNEGHETEPSPSKGKGSDSRKLRRKVQILES